MLFESQNLPAGRHVQNDHYENYGFQHEILITKTGAVKQKE